MTAEDFVVEAGKLMAEYPTASAYSLAPVAWQRAGGDVGNIPAQLHLLACAIVMALQRSEVEAVAMLAAQLDEHLQRDI